MKHDYTYIALLDEATTKTIKLIQEKLSKEFGHSEYVDHWNPHITISFGNLLTVDELESIKKECELIAKEMKPFTISLGDIAFIKKEVQGVSYHTLRFTVAPSVELDALSEKILAVAKKYETPFDAFSNDHFHVGLGRYQTPNLDENKVTEIVNLHEIPMATIQSFSIFYSMMNDPKPAHAEEVATFKFTD